MKPGEADLRRARMLWDYLAGSIPPERILSGLAGEALRLESYAKSGLIDPGDPVPKEILDAARALQETGFDSRALP